MNRVRIGIDGYNLAMANGTGVATYGKTLGDTIIAAGHALDGVFGIDAGRDPAIREVRFYDAIGRAGEQLTARQRRHRAIGNARRLLFGTRAVEVPITDLIDKAALADRLPAFDRLWSAPRLFETAGRRFRMTGRFLTVRLPDPPAIMHWTYPVPLKLAGARNVYTLHDLVPLRLPYTSLDDKTGYHRLVARCVEAADHICTVSDTSRDDIRARFPIDENRVTTTWQASSLAPEAFESDPGEDAAEIEGMFGLPRHGYFLFFGAIEPKKNLGRLIEAYLSLGTETPLVIVGARAWRSERELALISGDALGPAARRIVRLDYLSRRVLAKLIRGARAVLFPSLFEGFGLPALEAMELSVPLLASDCGSLPEVTGDAALRVDPYDVGSIASALRALDSDDALRARLSAIGVERAARFSRTRYQERLSAMYEAILSAPTRRG